MKLVWDCETNGFLKRVSTMHTLHIKDADSDQRWTFRRHGHVKGTRFDGTEYEFDPRDDLEEGLEILSQAEMFIGHNLIDYDLAVMRKLFPKWEHKATVRDTLILTRMIVPDTSAIDMPKIRAGILPGRLLGKHSLEAWGYRLGILKGDYTQTCKELGRDPFAEWNPDLEEYGDLDVDVTKVLWENCLADLPELSAVEFEHDAARLATKVRDNGFPFDHAAALTLKEELEAKYETHFAIVKERYGYWYAPEKKRIVRPIYDDPDIKSRPTPFSKKMKDASRRGKEDQVVLEDYQTNGYQKPRPEFGEDDSRAIWADVTVPKKPRKAKIILPDGSSHHAQYVPDAPYCKIKRVEFNPGSRDQIADRLVIQHAWSPSDFTPSGKPEINDEVLTKLKDDIPEAGDLADIFFYLKILGQLSTGDKSWLHTYDETTGCIHGTINTTGTVSGRCSHSEPNLGQVPGVVDTKIDGKKVILTGRAGDYGWESRRLFHTPARVNGEEWRQIGVDLVNIEGRCLAAILAPYDDGELIHELTVKGTDLHNFNMAKTGINNRNLIKRVFFGLIYGAGDQKLGATAEPYWSEARQKKYGRELRATIMTGIPALKKATDKIKEQAKSGFLVGVDGRPLQVRAEYAAFNLRLQSDAGLIAKKWWLLSEEALLDAGGDHGWDGDFAMLAFVHDEIQTAVKAFFAEQAAELIKDAARRAGEAFNYICPVAADAKIGHNWAECH